MTTTTSNAAAKMQPTKRRCTPGRFLQSHPDVVDFQISGKNNKKMKKGLKKLYKKPILLKRKEKNKTK